MEHKERPGPIEKVIAEAKASTDPFEKEMAVLSNIGDRLFTSICADIMHNVAVEAGPTDLAKLGVALQSVYGDSDPRVGVFMEDILQAAKSDVDFSEQGWKGLVAQKRAKFAELTERHIV